MYNNKIKINENMYDWERGGNNYHHPPQLEVMSLFLNSNFANIIFVCSEKGYIYTKEINSLLCIDSRYYINKLVKLNILEEFNLTKNQLDKLILIKKLNKNNIIQLTTYRFTDHMKLLLQNPEVYRNLCERCNLKIKRYIDHLDNIYNERMEDIEREKQEYKERLIFRYNLAKRKNEKFRTAEDYAIIQEVEKNV